MTTINAATKAILNGTKLPVPTTSDMKGALGALFDVLNECGITDGLAAFQALKSGNGYQRLAKGVILQWGSGATNSGGYALVSCPIAFPTGPLVCFAIGTSTNNNSYSVTVANQGSGSFEVRSSLGNSAAILGFNWFAIGY